MSDRFFIGSCDLDLHIDNCQSLKDKRRVITSLKEKVKNRYNVAICEFGDLSLWQRTRLGVVTCGNNKQHVDSSLKAVLSYIQKFRAISVVDFDLHVS